MEWALSLHDDAYKQDKAWPQQHARALGKLLLRFRRQYPVPNLDYQIRSRQSGPAPAPKASVILASQRWEPVDVSVTQNESHPSEGNSTQENTQVLLNSLKRLYPVILLADSAHRPNIVNFAAQLALSLRCSSLTKGGGLSTNQALIVAHIWRELDLGNSCDASLQDMLDFLAYLAHHLDSYRLQAFIFHDSVRKVLIKASNVQSPGPSQVVVELLNYVADAVVPRDAAFLSSATPQLMSTGSGLGSAGIRCLSRLAKRQPQDTGGRLTLTSFVPLLNWLCKSYDAEHSLASKFESAGMPAIFVYAVNSLIPLSATDSQGAPEIGVDTVARNDVLQLVGMALCACRAKDDLEMVESPSTEFPPELSLPLLDLRSAEDAEYQAFARYMQSFLKEQASSATISEPIKRLLRLAFDYVRDAFRDAPDVCRDAHLDEACEELIQRLREKRHLEDLGTSWNGAYDAYTIRRYALSKAYRRTSV